MDTVPTMLVKSFADGKEYRINTENFDFTQHEAIGTDGEPLKGERPAEGNVHTGNDGKKEKTMGPVTGPMGQSGAIPGTTEKKAVVHTAPPPNDAGKPSK